MVEGSGSASPPVFVVCVRVRACWWLLPIIHPSSSSPASSSSSPSSFSNRSSPGQARPRVAWACAGFCWYRFRCYYRCCFDDPPTQEVLGMDFHEVQPRLSLSPSPSSPSTGEAYCRLPTTCCGWAGRATHYFAGPVDMLRLPCYLLHMSARHVLPGST